MVQPARAEVVVAGSRALDHPVRLQTRMAQWKRWWWCLLITADLSLASGVEECFLYPVKKREQSPSFPLQVSGDTIITINNIYDNNTFSTINIDDGDCVAQVIYKNTNPPLQDGCPVLNCSAAYRNSGARQELVTVVVRRRGNTTTVYLRDSGDDEQHVEVVHGASHEVHVVSEEFVNVAYGCHQGCFQFEKATIHRSFRDGRYGSLLFFGRAMGSEPLKRTIYVLKDTSWSQWKGEHLEDSIMNNTHWFAFRARPQYYMKDGTLRLNLTIQYENVSSSCSPEDPACITRHKNNYVGEVPSEDLYITFEATENIQWAVFCRPQEATEEEPGGEDQPALTITTSPTILIYIPLTTSGPLDHSRDFITQVFLGKTEVVNWIFWVVGASLVLLLVAAALQRQRRLSRPPPQPSNSPGVNDDDDPSGHIYEYVDIDSLNKQLAKDKSISLMDLSHQNNTRKSHSSINSLYGYTSPHTTENTTQ